MVSVEVVAVANPLGSETVASLVPLWAAHRQSAVVLAIRDPTNRSKTEPGSTRRCRLVRPECLSLRRDEGRSQGGGAGYPVAALGHVGPINVMGWESLNTLA